MIIKLIKNIKVCFFILFLMGGVFFAGEARGDILSVTFYSINFNNSIPVGDPRNYIKFGGNDTIIEVDVRTDDTGWGIITSVSVTIPTDGVDIVMSINPGGLGPVGPATAVGGGTFTANITDLGPNSEYQNFRVSFTYTPDNTISESIVTARNIEAAAVSTNSPPATTDNQNYGVIIEGITSVGLTVAFPGAGIIDGRNYYLSGVSGYTFDVPVTSNGHSWGCIDDVTVTIPTDGVDIVMSINPGGLGPVGLTAAVGGGTFTANVGGVDHRNFIVTFTYTPDNSVPVSILNNRDIEATAESALFPGVLGNAIQNTNYGIEIEGITSVGLTVAFPGAGIIDGRNYYLSGVSGYTFDVPVTSNGHSWGCIDDVTVTIPTDGVDIVMSINPGGLGPVGLTAAVGGGTFTANVGGVDHRNFIVTFTYTPDNSVPVSILNNRDIEATAESALFPGVLGNAIQNTNYGIIVDGITNVITTITAGADTSMIGTSLAPYFLPSRSYIFEVDIIANGHSWNTITDVTLNIPIPLGVPVSISIDPSSLVNHLLVTHTAFVTGGGSAIADISDIGLDDPWNNFKVTFTYTPDWTVDEAAVVNRNITATAKSVFDSTDVSSSPVNHNYGVCSSVKVILEHDPLSEAADGLVNPWHGAFNISGGIVYNIATINDISHVTAPNLVDPPGDITSIGSLHYSHDIGPAGDTGITNTGSGALLEYIITANLFSTFGTIPNDGIGFFTWVVPVDIIGIPSGDYVSNLTLICDKIEIIGMEFQSGGGYSLNAPVYNRNIYTSGTQVRVRARMQYGSGNTTAAAVISLGYDYNNNATYDAINEITNNINLSSGQEWSDWAEIKNPKSGDDWGSGSLDPGETIAFNSYNIISISGTGGHFGGVGQNDEVKIKQDAYIAPFTNPTILWDNADPPGDGAANTKFTSWVSTTPVSDAIVLTWTPLAANIGVAGEDADFWSYRIYYKETTGTAWYMIDRNADAVLGNIATGTYTIINLQPLTSYDYYVTAIDVFGNETGSSNRSHAGTGGALFDSTTTYPSSALVTISDGINRFEDVSFTDDPFPSARQLFESSIRVEVFIVGATQPDELNVILADNGLNTDLVDTGGALDSALAENTDYYRVSLSKTSPNTWVGHISSENPLITVGQECKFILEAIQAGSPVYYDHDSELEDPLTPNPNDYPWRFSIIDPPKVTPWPTRILNNVITSKNPVAYPAYYLTDDAYVTIIAYDIKGRPVATLLDNAFRRSGQNIREQGWRGTNKAGRKLGVGLYYVHIKAKRVSDGKTIINKFEKVVMAR